MSMSRALLIVLACTMITGARAQSGWLDDGAWKEGEVPAPPAFSMDRLIRFEVNPNSPLVYAVDPQTISISQADRVLRYVVVARSPSGGRNVFYEGLRCATAEVKTYARHTGEAWVMMAEPQWAPMASRPSRHALMFARQGACDIAGTPSQPADVVRALRQSAGSGNR